MPLFRFMRRGCLHVLVTLIVLTIVLAILQQLQGPLQEMWRMENG